MELYASQIASTEQDDTESQIDIEHSNDSPSNTVATGLSCKASVANDSESPVNIGSPDDSPLITIATGLRSKGTIAATGTAEGQGSNGKIFKHVGVKRKAD
ncbi:hypothetical protein PIB30_028166 [Stylosanthes scabra]|uniref:Uncharacterized protein n=1 Tax=Stylosanthes scabra TaxID=79078 RepID=A0ABU6Z7N9_9FABA|nr:hypothetical protein [Stylosanthes scabra]